MNQDEAIPSEVAVGVGEGVTMDGPATPATTPQPAGSGQPLGRFFGLFWTGQTLAMFGTRLGAVALPVLAVQLLHATPDQLGYLNAASTAAFLLVGLPAGAWVDRWFKRRTMIRADLVRFAAAFAVPILWTTHHLQLWHLYVVAAVVGIATTFFDVAYQSFVPVLVDDNQIARANGRLESTNQLASLGGPAIGGLALKWISAPLLMLADAFGYLMSVVFLLMTRDHEAQYRAANPPAADHGPSLVREIREGLDFVLHHPVLRRITACTGLSNLFQTMTFTLYPLLTLSVLGLSPFVFGITMTASALGGTLGAMLSGRLSSRFGEGRTVFWTAALFGPVAVLVPAATLMPNRTLAAALLIVVDFASSVLVLVYNITQVSMRQRLCPKNLLGRMNASIRFLVWGVMPIGALVGGWLGHRLGVTPSMWLTSALSTLAVVPVLGLTRLMASRDEAPAR